MSKSRKVEIVAVALAVLCLGCLLLSTRYYFGFGLSSYNVSCASGCVFVTKLPPPSLPYTFFHAEQSPLAWTAEIIQLPPNGFMFNVPLWVPFFMFGVVAVLAHRRARKPKRGTCEKCRYNLTGNTTGVCPECGTPT